MIAVGRPSPGSSGWSENQPADPRDAIDAVDTHSAADTHHAVDAFNFAVPAHHAAASRRASISHSIKSMAAGGSCIQCWYPGREPRVITAEVRRARLRERIAASFGVLAQGLSNPAGKRRNAAISKAVNTIERLFKEVKRLAALMPDVVPGDDSAVVTVFEKEAYRCVDALSCTAFSRLYQGPLSPRVEQADAGYRHALLMRLHRCMALPAETVLSSLEQALRGRHLDQVHVAWLFTARRELSDRTTSTLARRAACLTAEQDRRKLQSALHGIFLRVSQGQPDTLHAGMGVLLALARLPSALRSIYQRCLPFAILNEATQELPRHWIPTPLAIDEPRWQRYCQSWKDEYVRRMVAVDKVIGSLRETCRLPDAQSGTRTRRAALGLRQLAGLMRVGLAGEDAESQPGGERLDPARHGEIGHRYADVVEVVQAAAGALGLRDDPARDEDDTVRILRQEAVFNVLSDQEFAALVSAADVMAAFGLLVDARAVAVERDHRVARLARARLKPCLERLAAMTVPAVAASAVTLHGNGEDLQMAEVGTYLRDATDVLQELVLLYSVCGGKLDGAEETAALIEKAVNLAMPDLRIAPARAQVLRRLSVALNHARADLARHDPGLHEDAEGLLSREDLMQGIAERLASQEDIPDVMDGAFFALIRRTSFAARLGAFVSSAPARLMGGGAADLDPAEFDQDEDVLADADIRWALQSDFGIEVVAPARDAMAQDAMVQDAAVQDAVLQDVVVQDAFSRHVQAFDDGRVVAVREIYREELSFKNAPIRKLSTLAATGAPGTYPVNAAIVDPGYVLDYQRGSCSLSVRGRTPDGTPLSFDAVDTRPIIGEVGPGSQERKHARVNAVDEALRCLGRIVDAGQFQRLTQLLSQMAAAPISVAEWRAGTGTPLRLASGTPVQFGGAAHIHTLIEQNLDDTFDMSYHVEWQDVNAASTVDQTAQIPTETIILNRVLSRKAVRYAWRLSGGAEPSVQPLQLAQYQYRFVPAPPSRSSTFSPENE